MRIPGETLLKESEFSIDGNDATLRPTKRQKVQGLEATIKPDTKVVARTQVSGDGPTETHRKADLVRKDMTNDDSFHLSLSALSAPCDYIKSLPSKGVRSSLIDALNVWLQVPEKELAVIKHVIRTLHNSSLILDDIEDNSPLRRGKTATHVIFGPAQAINSANFLYVSAVKAIRTLKSPEAMDVLLEELQNLFVGQSWDLYWKFNLSCPTRSEYLTMVDHKTGAMFRMFLRLMAAVSPPVSPTCDIEPLARLVGRYYQIRDDYMNLQGVEYSEQKGFCEDLDEGKFSYPVVHCFQADRSSQDLIRGIFRQRQMTAVGTPLTVESKLQILGCMEKAGTFDATWELLRQLEEEMEKEVEVLESKTAVPNPMMHLLLKTLEVPQWKGVGEV